MDMEMMKWLFDGMEGQTPITVSATDDPVGWVESQLENNEDLAFVEEGHDVWSCRCLKRGHMIKVEVSVEEGSVKVIASIDVVPDEETVLPIRVFQMVENGTFKYRGYLPARAGERVSYGAMHAIKDGFELNTLIDRAISSIAGQAEEIERINSGEAVGTVYWENKTKRIGDRARFCRATSH